MKVSAHQLHWVCSISLPIDDYDLFFVLSLPICGEMKMINYLLDPLLLQPASKY
jgi:hypothetical protein